MPQIKGIAGSRGEKAGIAKVIKSLDGVNKFTAGDILVTEATNPSWTPIIHAASAVVTDLGGALCHAAIVCREYGIPAVVGTKTGTKRIKSGDKIIVNGTKGVVELNLLHSYLRASIGESRAARRAG